MMRGTGGRMEAIAHAVIFSFAEYTDTLQINVSLIADAVLDDIL